MKTMRWFLPLTILTVVVLGFVGGPAPAGDDADGKAVFEAQKCSMCHAVASEGIEAKVKSAKMQGPELGKSAEMRDAEWLAKYLKKEVQIDGRDHKKAFKGTDAELDALVRWIDSLPAE